MNPEYWPDDAEPSTSGPYAAPTLGINYVKPWVITIQSDGE